MRWTEPTVYHLATLFGIDHTRSRQVNNRCVLYDSHESGIIEGKSNAAFPAMYLVVAGVFPVCVTSE